MPETDERWPAVFYASRSGFVNSMKPMPVGLIDIPKEWTKFFKLYISTRTAATFHRLQHGGIFRGVGWFIRPSSDPRDSSSYEYKLKDKTGAGWGPGDISSRLNFESGDMEKEAINSGKISGSSISWNMTLPYAHFWQLRRPYLFFDSKDIENASIHAAGLLKTNAQNLLDIDNGTN